MINKNRNKKGKQRPYHEILFLILQILNKQTKGMVKNKLFEYAAITPQQGNRYILTLWDNGMIVYSCSGSDVGFYRKSVTGHIKITSKGQEFIHYYNKISELMGNKNED